MFVIWRSWGWLVLPFILLVWLLAESVVQPIYRSIAGYEFMYNADKLICWGIAFFLGAAALFAFNLLLMRGDGKPITPERWKKNVELRARLAEEDPVRPAEQSAAIAAAIRAEPIPPAGKSSTFFFIPMRFMPIVFAIVGVIMLAINIPVAIEEIPLHQQ